MYKIENAFDRTQRLQEFKTLKSAVFYADKYLDETFHVIKIVDKKIVDIYEIFQGSLTLVATSCATGREYSYLKI